MKKFISVLIIISCLLLLFSCSRPHYNIKGENAETSVSKNISQDDNTLVFVSLSGGGTRAAAMSWKALEELKKIPHTYIDKKGNRVESTLANEIDYISGISGGSFAAAAWCFYKDDMDLFRKRFIERDIEGDLEKKVFFPPNNLIKLLSPYYDRINIASEFYDNEVFDKKTFNDLPVHPVLWINATHLALGERFTFDKTHFDYLSSDLSKYPIGYACAASSAFPVLLSPLTMRNYSELIDLSDDTKYNDAKLRSREHVEEDFYCRSREFYNNPKNKFVHLADGGVVDNQGLQAIIDQFETNGIILKKLNDSDNPLERLIIININAGVSSKDESCEKENAPKIPSVIKYTMVSSMDILSAKRWKKIKERCDELNQAHIDGLLPKLEKPYAIEINFRNIEDEKDRIECNKLPTSFKLSSEQVRLIDRVVPALINEEPNMKRLKKAEEVNRIY
jgi:predicted acylesterase/phospholipase RssA